MPTEFDPALTRQVRRFAVSGLANVGVDLGIYTLLVMLGLQVPYAKGAAFAGGTLFAYLVNSRWTFHGFEGGFGKLVPFSVLYMASMSLNVGINSSLLSALGPDSVGFVAAYISATAVSACLNFVGMRRLFSATEKTEAVDAQG